MHDLIAKAAARGSLSEHDAKRLLAAFGVAVPRSNIAAAPQDVAQAVSNLTPPYAVKVMSQDIVHKSDIGGVWINLPDSDAVRASIEAMAAIPAVQNARVDGYLIEEMAPAGREVVIGGVRDPRFGPLIMVGLGGVFVEVLADVAFRLCPIGEADARAMLSELRGSALLDGVRGQAGVAKDAIVDALLKIGGTGGLLMTHGADIAEIDINPLIVSQNGAVAADARVILSRQAQRSDSPAPDRAPREYFAPLFAPQTVAVLGASTTSVAIANTFIRRLQAFGYAGDIYPIHPQADEVEGLPAYPRIADAPKPVDYAYIAIGANRIPDVLGATEGRLKFAQVISSGFGEIADGRDLEAELVAKARQGGCRVIGPNCLGLYSPRGGVTFPVGAPKETGTIGVVLQSGGLGTDLIKRGQWRGLRFSGLVTAGNSADLGPADFLAFYVDDPQTQIVGLYLEDVKDGRRFFDLLRSSAVRKPVVLLRGGWSRQGRLAAASHTGALAGDDHAWQALTRQTGTVMVATIDEFIDTLLAFQQLELRPTRPTQNVVLFGNGGGTSVLATDFFASAGLEVLPLPDTALAKLQALRLPPGTSIANPIDTPVRTLQEEEGRIANTILDIIYQHGAPDAVVMHLNLAAFVGRGDVDPIDNLIQAAQRTRTTFPAQAHFVMVLRSDGSPELDDKKRQYRQRILDIGVPVYDELHNAALALKAISRMEQRFAGTG